MIETTFIPQVVRRTRKRNGNIKYQTFKYSVMKDEVEIVPNIYSKLLGRSQSIEVTPLEY